MQFERVLVPTMVRNELAAGGAKNQGALRALAEYAFFENCDEYDPALVSLLLGTRSSAKEGRDQGEAEAVIQAAQFRADMVLVDDSLGREWAAKHSLHCHGTIWICGELRRAGFLPELRKYFLLMLQGGRRQPVQEMNKFLREFGEQDIADP